MHLHVVGLPHTQTIAADNQCAFTALARMFATMMHREGHAVTLYAGDQNEAECDELVTIMPKYEQDVIFGEQDWYKNHEVMYLDYDHAQPYWPLFCFRALAEIQSRLSENDIVCLPAGHSMHWLIDPLAAQGVIVCEFEAGYSGIHAPYVVYPSYAWRATVQGHWQGAATADGKFTDTVIPHYAEAVNHPAGEGDIEDYFLCLSRMNERKGYHISAQATREIGSELIVGGVGGDRPEQYDHITYAGFLGPAERAELLGKARALFCPTLYLEAFGLVVIEAMMCGTPVITTDWGSFPEIVRQGVDGFRCVSMREFIDAAMAVDGLDRGEIRAHALANYSTEAIGPRYTRYFERILDRDGFYAGTNAKPV